MKSIHPMTQVFVGTALLLALSSCGCRMAGTPRTGSTPLAFTLVGLLSMLALRRRKHS